MKIETVSTPPPCPVCRNLLGDLDPGQDRHKFCAWATEDDWKALRPYLTGTLLGVHAGGA
jgi:hypothetical protein